MSVSFGIPPHSGRFFPPVLLWEGFVSWSIFGFGTAILRVTGRTRQPLALAGCFGVAFWLALGGPLVYWTIASPRCLIALLSVGAVGGLWAWPSLKITERWRGVLRAWPKSTSGRVAGLLLCAYILLLVAIQVRPTVWNRYDDLTAYMAFAAKAHALHGLASDPFSERRMATGLGGGTFLNMTMLAGADDSTMGFLDAGFGLVLFMAAMAAFLRKIRLSGGQIIFVLCFFPIFIIGKLNLTIVYLSAALFLGMLMLFDTGEGAEGPTPSVSSGLITGALLGLLLGSQFTLKSSNIVFSCVLLLLLAAALAWMRRSARPILPLLLVIPVSLLILAPWALHFRSTQGTLLFPVFGRGYDGSAYGLPTPAQTSSVGDVLFLAAPDMFLLLLSIALVWRWTQGQHTRLRTACLCFLAATAIAFPIDALATGGEALDRYALPFLSPAVLMVLAVIASCWDTLSRQRRRRSILLAGCWAFFYITVIAISQHFYDQASQVTAFFGSRKLLHYYDTLLSPADMTDLSDRLRAAQDTVPPGAVILESTGSAFGYDWRRNEVYVSDYPGMAGLPPGLPFTQTPDAVRRYLAASGIDYLIFDRALMYPSAFEDFMRHPQVRTSLPQLIRHIRRRRREGSWVRMQSAVCGHTMELMAALAQERKPVYDDGRIMVIPLTGPEPQGSLISPPRLSTSPAVPPR